ncbi:UvrD-helicase domain-containing protein [Candidatus Babeliales bacterium]|nr:UvrD-helicase domain-containing protein [Candidatus Babeliales bacterium]
MFEQKQSFDTFVTTQLNHEQKAAVQAKDGTFLVIAGAGSGKTRVITARITNLILHHNVEPSSIIALTFTNKAAQEMQHRIGQFLPHLRTKPIIATFHAYCLKLLKKHNFLNNIPDFSVIDAQDAHKLLLTIMKEKSLEKLFNAKQLLSFFSNFKMNDVLKLETPEWNMHHAQQFMELYNAYEQQKRLSNYLDFDDLLYKTYELFVKNPEFASRHLAHHRHILVDEYQDTNLIQHELLKQMTQQNKKLAVDSVCAVGDEDQSIYSWRGANVKNILEFHSEFLGTKKIKLEQNYRSTQQILDIANSVIKHNIDRNHKQLWSSNSKQHQPLLLECLSDLQESALVAQLIHVLSKQESLNSIAILYRTHYQSRIIEEALIKENIAYKMIGGISFYERKEIKDLLAYLRLVINPFDRISLFRVINCPARGLGEKFEEQFVQTWTQNPFCNWQEIAKILLSENQLAKKQAASLQEFLNFFEKFHENNEITNSVTQFLEHFIKVTGYLTYLANSFEKIEAEEKKENVTEFLRAAAYFDEHQKTGLSQFLDEISLMQEMIKQDDATTQRVNMMTLHSAKGLEFNTVMLVGLEEGLLPSSQSIGQENVAEERRLFYVGITRAREKLFISHSKYRNTFGKLDQQRPSRFLQEIPRNLMLQQEAAHWSKSSFITFFQEWISGKQQKTVQKNSAPQILQSETATSFSANIKRLQSVKHEKFGLGIAHNVEQKGDKIFVTVHFTHHGTKKIESSFLKIV